VQTRNETLEKLQFAKQGSVPPVFRFSAGNVDEVKKAISTLGSVVSPQTPPPGRDPKPQSFHLCTGRVLGELW